MASGFVKAYNKSRESAYELVQELQQLNSPWLPSVVQAKHNNLVRDWENAYNMEVGSPEYLAFEKEQERLIALMNSEDR